MEEKYVAIIVQKIKVSKDIYFLKLDSIVKDAVMTNDKTLIDENKDRYQSIENSGFYTAKHNNLAYIFPFTYNEIKDIYCKDSLKEAIKKYVDTYNLYAYFAVLDSKQNVKVVQIDKDNLKKTDTMTINANNIEVVNTSDDVFLKLPEKMLDDMISDFKKEDLDFLHVKFMGLKEICNEAHGKSVKDNKRNNSLTIKKDNKPKFETDDLHKLDILNVYDKITEEVVGQDDIIKKLLMTIDKNTYANSFADSSEDRYHILIVGPSGSGKTRMMRSLQRHLNWPLVRIDTTQITMNGYHGGTIEDNILKPLLTQANGNIEVAQKGIVNLDEIDKKGSKDNQDVAGRGVLNAFLPFLDGTTYEVKYNSNHYPFDTSQLTVLATGAFADLLEENGKQPVGFMQMMNQDKTISKNILEKSGNIPIEFLGRFPSLAQMRELIDKDLKEILVKPKTSPLTFRRNYLFDCYNVELKWLDDYIDAIVAKALKLKTGGRSLKEIIGLSLYFAEWQIIEAKKFKKAYKELIVSGETIENPKKYILK